MRPQQAVNIFRSPYNSWSLEKILGYFQTRDSVNYFPVIDEVECARAKADGVLINRFEFNGESYQFADRFDWRVNPGGDIEWQILLHKFYYSVGLGRAYHETKNERYAEKWIELTSAWIAEVPLDFLTSDVAGRRIQNWIYAHYYFVSLSRPAALDADFYLRFLRSIHQQVEWLRAHLTPARNHRTLELTAIFLAAVVFPELQGADERLESAITELLKNMQSDLLGDGAQCELSTDYHCIVLRNLLSVRRLAALNHIPLPEEMDALIRRALDFAMWIHKPDGFIPALSDGDTGSFLELLEQGSELYGDAELKYVGASGRSGKAPAQRSKGFAASGYYILRSGWGAGAEAYADEKYLIFDCGPLGAGNHGHLDLLSFELAAYGQSLIVDPGRYTYDESGDTNWRVLFRGTAYHNTVVVDGRNQTRYEFHKRKFKIRGPEPDRELKSFVTRDGFDYLHGIARSHEYAAVHERKIFFLCPEYWIVSDLLLADQPHQYDLLFHLSDQAEGKTTAEINRSLLITAPHLVMAQAVDPTVRSQIETGYVSPRYGVRHAAPVVRFSARAERTQFQTVLYPWKTERPEISVERLTVTADDSICADHQASAIRISVSHQGRRWSDFYFNVHQEAGVSFQFADFLFQGKLLFVRQDEEGREVRRYQL
jgi:hypothetical protein